METKSRDEEERSDGWHSCWGRLKLKLPWNNKRLTRRYRQSGQRSSAGGFGYDPLSYAQNFDEGLDQDDEEDHDIFRRGFSARFAAVPLSKPVLQADK